MREHEQNTGQYRRNPLKHFIKQYDRRVKKKREEIELEMQNNNAKYCRLYVVKKSCIAQMRLIKEVIKIIDAKEEERKYMIQKYRYKEEFIGLEARNAFSGNKVTASIIKYANIFNHNGLRYAMINNKIIKVYCSRCN